MVISRLFLCLPKPGQYISRGIHENHLTPLLLSLFFIFHILFITANNPAANRSLLQQRSTVFFFFSVPLFSHLYYWSKGRKLEKKANFSNMIFNLFAVAEYCIIYAFDYFCSKLREPFEKSVTFQCSRSDHNFVLVSKFLTVF